MAVKSRNITDFFKPFTIPKNRVQVNNEIEDEIVLATSLTRRDALHSGDPFSSRPSSNQCSPKWTKPTSPPCSKATAGQSPLKGPTMSLLDGPADDDLLHSSPTSSKRRELSAVMVPSPPPLLDPKAEVSAQRDTMSFSSLSSLASVPLSTQSSSRRVLKDGICAVTNSESGSADNSSDELADPATFIVRKRRKLTPPGKDAAHAIEVPVTVKPARQSIRLSHKSTPTRTLAPSPPRAVYKHSLLQLVKQNERRDKSKAKIAHIEASLEEAERRRAEEEANAAAMDARAVAAMADDSDEGERMMQAMERTDALRDEQCFHFFTTSVPRPEKRSFPAGDLPDEPWANLLKTEQSRTQACLTGFVAELAAQGRLPENVVQWFAYQLPRERREDLREAYVEAVQASSTQPVSVPQSLTNINTFYDTVLSSDGDDEPVMRSTNPVEQQHGDLHTMDRTGQLLAAINCVCGFTDNDGNTIACEACNSWQHTACYYQTCDGQAMPEDKDHYCIGCQPRNLNVHDVRKRQKARRELLATTSTSRAINGSGGSPPGLRYVIRVIQHCAFLFGTDAVSEAIACLALVKIDEHIIANGSLRCIIGDAVESLLQEIPDAELEYSYAKVQEHLFDHDVKLSRLWQCRAVTHLPATTVRSHELRRRLALFLILQDKKPKDLTSPGLGVQVLSRLKSAPEFAISDSTDYNLLLHLTEVLDISIDAGFSDFGFLETSKSKHIGLFGKPAPSPDAEQAFNAQIDALTKQLRLLAFRIKDAGATHLRRTEAKSAFERLIVRLEHSVRTRPKPRKSLFGGSAGESKAFLDGFVKKSAGVEAMSPAVKVLNEGEAQKEDVIDGLGQVSGGRDAVGGADDTIVGMTLSSKDASMESS